MTEENEATETAKLNEAARLYPWRKFDQREIRLMVGCAKQVVSAAFADASVPAQFGKSRPEYVAAWIDAQERKIKVTALGA